ncbi:Auxin-induced protein 10A5 [Linum grandiflorum]
MKRKQTNHHHHHYYQRRQSQTSSSSSPSRRRSVPKGHIAVYVGEVDERKRFVVPISVLNHPLFLDLLKLAEDEFGYYPPHGALTIPCHEHEFIDLLVASSLLYTL